MQIEIEEYSSLVSQIYDCALDPSLWSRTLTQINEHLECAFSAIFLAQTNPFQPLAYFHSPWDEGQLQRLVYEFAIDIPGVVETMAGPIGVPVSLLERLDGSGVNTYRESRFYREWVAPQIFATAVC